MASEWSLDFCLVCDRQTLGGPYCSQSCRLAELDVSNEHAPKPRVAPKRTSSLGGSGGTTNPPHNTTGTSSYRPHYSGALSPSSSQTSLSSLRSNLSQASTISSQFQTELRDYASCFDHVRDLKRRLAA